MKRAPEAKFSPGNNSAASAVSITVTQKEAVVPQENKSQDPAFPAHIRTEMVLVTPADAERYLATMHDNRSQSKLEKGLMTANIIEGNWFAGISPVFFDDGDPMRAWDGQHRFEAIIESGQAVYMLFIVGVTENEAEYIDTGRKRTRADWYKMNHLSDYSRRATVSRMLALYDKYGVEGVRNPAGLVLTAADQDKWVDADGMTEVIRAGNALSTATGANPTYAAYSVFRTMQDGVIDPDGFWEKVRTGINLGEHDPALTLRNFLVSDKRKAGRLPADPRLMELYVLATAWNRHVTGERWSKPSPRFEVKNNGKKVFPASAVPDYLPLKNPRQLGALRAAFAEVRR